MEAFKEVGLIKSVKFIIYVIIEFFLSVIIVPQARTGILRLLGVKIGKNSLVFKVDFMNLYRGSFKNLTLGEGCYIGNGVLLDLTGKINIENNVTIAERSILLTHMNVGYKTHPLQKIYPSIVKDITVGEGSFIGISSIVLPGITISRESMVAAGSVVAANVSQRTLVGGIPAKTIKSLNL